MQLGHGVTRSSAPRGVGCHEQLASQKGPGGVNGASGTKQHLASIMVTSKGSGCLNKSQTEKPFFKVWGFKVQGKEGGRFGPYRCK